MPEQIDFASGRNVPERPVASVHVPDHELIRLIGQGGYGQVWLAKNSLGTFRAIKIVYANTFEDRRPFEREFNGVQKFEPVSRLHEGLMDVLQVGRNDSAGYFYCVMELADDVVCGQVIDPENYLPRTLAYERKKHKPLSIPDCARLGAGITSALEFLHEHGLIHRDVKPSNVVFVNGLPKLADIGLVAQATEAKSYVGTEGFIPPEGPGTVQADIYSFGKVLYELSTGKDRHDYPELPDELCEGPKMDEILAFSRIFLKACRADPRQRYKSAAAMGKDLAFLLEGKPERFPALAKRYFVRAVEVAVAVAVVTGILLVSFGKKEDQQAARTPHGLISWWRGENSTADWIGGNQGEVAGPEGVSYEPGIAGQAFVFEGIHRNRIDLGSPTNLQLQNFTIEAWIRRSNPTNISRDDVGEDGSKVGGGGLLLSFGSTGYGFGLMNEGCLFLSRLDTDCILSSNLVTDTDWHHVAVTKWETNVWFYVDGVAASAALPWDTMFFFDTRLAIGSRGDALGGTFWGAIDEMTVSDRVLSLGEIRAIYQARGDGKYLSGLRPAFLPMPGLVDRWSGDGDARSASGSHDGVLMNGVTFVEGKLGKAFCFDGRNQYVKIPGSTDFDVGVQLTVAFWMKGDPDRLTRWEGLFGSDFYGINISSGFNSTRKGINFGLSTVGGKTHSPDLWPATADINEGGAPFTSGWHHVVGTYDGAKLQLYLDGSAWGKPVVHTGSISTMATNAFITIGSEEGGSMEGRRGRYFKGLIDEVYLFNRALSVDEIEYLCKTSRPDALVASGK